LTVIWRRWSKFAVIINEDPDLILCVNDQIKLAIVIDIPKRQGYGDKILPITKENRTNVDQGFGTICSWTFKHFQMAM